MIPEVFEQFLILCGKLYSVDFTDAVILAAGFEFFLGNVVSAEVIEDVLLCLIKLCESAFDLFL